MKNKILRHTILFLIYVFVTTFFYHIACRSHVQRALAQSPPTPDRVIVIKDKPLHQVIEIIAMTAKVNIVVNWNALEAMGIEKDDTISLHLKNISFEHMLRLVLDQASDGYAELAYMVDEGVIHISTKEDLGRRTNVKAYDIKDLLINVPDFKGRRINIDNIGQGNQGEGGIGGGRFLRGRGAIGGNNGGLFSGNNDEDTNEEDMAGRLVDLIHNTIDPESWRVSGGNVGSVYVLGPQLIVSQTSTAHQQLRDLYALDITF